MSEVAGILNGSVHGIAETIAVSHALVLGSLLALGILCAATHRMLTRAVG